MMPYYVYVALAFTNLIPSVIGIVFFEKLPKAFRCIAILMAFSFLTELFSLVIAKAGFNNLYVIHIYSCIEIILLTIYFRSIIISDQVRKILLIACCIVALAIVGESIFQGIKWWNSFSSVLESSVIFFAAAYYYYEVATNISPDPVPSSLNFWCTGLIAFYFVSSLQYFLLSRYLLNNDPDTLLLFANVHTFVNAFCNLAYGVLLWMSVRSYRLAQ